MVTGPVEDLFWGVVWASSCCYSSSSTSVLLQANQLRPRTPRLPAQRGIFSGSLTAAPEWFPSLRVSPPNTGGGGAGTKVLRIKPQGCSPRSQAGVCWSKLHPLARPPSFVENRESPGRTSAGGRRCRDDPGLRGATPTPSRHEGRTLRPTLTVPSSPRLRWGSVPATRLLLLPVSQAVFGRHPPAQRGRSSSLGREGDQRKAGGERQRPAARRTPCKTFP